MRTAAMGMAVFMKTAEEERREKGQESEHSLQGSVGRVEANKPCFSEDSCLKFLRCEFGFVVVLQCWELNPWPHRCKTNALLLAISLALRCKIWGDFFREVNNEGNFAP